MRITYSKRQTKNLGNYENIVLHISVEDDVNLSVETKEECFLRLKGFVDNKLNDEINELSNNRKEQITHNSVKNLVISLVSKDESKRDVIKQHLLSKYKVSKVIELTTTQLIVFNNYLREL